MIPLHPLPDRLGEGAPTPSWSGSLFGALVAALVAMLGVELGWLLWAP